MAFDVDNAPPAAPGWSGGLIEALLDDQGDLSAVERFSRSIENNDHNVLSQPVYSLVLPSAPPGPGQQYAFEVELARCSGCKACVAACHSLNGLDDGETWRDVGLLLGGTAALPVLQHVTTACHHCLEPACLDACPVDAYEKDPVTGIVRHLDDQCFGCQYCTLACPYDVPKFHAGKGIVRKCDMCGDRLKAGEPPACAAACPHEAIRIRVVEVGEVRRSTDEGRFLPGAFDPAYTRPTTRFLMAPGLPLGPAEGRFDRPEHAHTPLALMLVLTQLSAGGFLIELVSRVVTNSPVTADHLFTLICLTAGLAGLGASLLHLGRPLYAYRAVLGIRHSWLSREVVALGLFGKLSIMFTLMDTLNLGPPGLRLAALGLAAIAGAAGVGCSVMVYHVVRRPFWSATISAGKFAGSAAWLGLGAGLMAAGIGAVSGGVVDRLPVLAALLGLASLAKLRFESRDLSHADGPLAQTSRLLRGPLRRSLGLRRYLGVLGGIVLPGLAVVGWSGSDRGVMVSASLLALAASLAGEFVERYLFFRAVAGRRMPGGMPS